MSLLHPALLFGLLLTAIPVVLHLLLRARPKKLDFPALRLLQQRRIQNMRRMRLRHLWLLLLRMAMLAALVFALARPSLPPANYAPTTGEWLGLAAVISLALATYFAVMTWWGRQPWPRHTLLARRTYLRGGVGLAAGLLALLLVAWPYQRRVAAEITSPAPPAYENLPVAAVFVCDTSLSMTYQFEGRSRLEAARQIAIDQLERLPAGSQAAVLDLAGDLPAVLSPDLAAIKNRLEALTPQPVVQSLDERIRAAVRFQGDERRRTLGAQANVAEDRRQDRFVREIYVLTDLAKSAWRTDDSGTLAAELAEVPWLGLYVIDVGIEQPTNRGVVDVRLSRPTVGAGGQVFVEATVRGIGPEPGDTVVELWQQTDDGPLAKRDQRTVALTGEPAAKVRFSLDNINGRVTQGDLRLVTSDPLAMDNAAYFSVSVMPPLKVLVVAEERAAAAYWLTALEGLNFTGTSYQTTFRTSEQLLGAGLAPYDLICLINVANPPPEVWRDLAQFARNGGGVLVCLGAPSSVAPGMSRRGIDPVAYALPDAQELLPVQPKASLRFLPPQHLDFRGRPHPMTQRLEALGVLAELGDVDFRWYWSVELNEGAVELARWTDDSTQPAWVYCDVGRGRCLVFTSSVDSIRWSDWRGNWTYLVVADQMLQFLARQSSSPHTFIVGDPVVLPLDLELANGAALLRLPDLTQRRVDIASQTRDITVTDVTTPGHYQVVRPGTPPQLLTGFSLNLPGAESELTRLTVDELDASLGKGRYGLARDPEQLSRSVLAGRLGQEVSGLLLSLLVLVFLVEQSTSTWFYRQDEG